MYIVIIIYIGLLLLFFGNTYIMYRNKEVYDFLTLVKDLEYNYLMRELNKGNYKMDFEYFYTLPSYGKLLFSFKKLKLENYFDNETIKLLKGQ